MATDQNVWNKRPEECNYSFVQNRNCEFFPCHKTAHPENFNCLFCYCPLYALGSGCMVPHGRKSYSYVTEHWNQISEIAKKNR